MRRCVFSAMLPFLVCCSIASAAPLPDGGVTPPDVVAILKAKGLPAELASLKDGAPIVRSAQDATKFAVYFYGCGDMQRCSSIQFSAGFSKSDLSSAQIETWNRTKRFGKAYLDGATAWVEWDVDVQHGATTEALENDFDRWFGVMSAFRKYLSP